MVKFRRYAALGSSYAAWRQSRLQGYMSVGEWHVASTELEMQTRHRHMSAPTWRPELCICFSVARWMFGSMNALGSYMTYCLWKDMSVAALRPELCICFSVTRCMFVSMNALGSYMAYCLWKGILTMMYMNRYQSEI